MTFDSDTGLHLPSTDSELPRRLARLRELGLGNGPDSEFDAFAARLAQDADAPYAMVNLITDQQYFVGLYTPSDRQPGGAPQAATDMPAMGRVMDLDHGFCPEVVERRKSLILPDVCASPRFSSNPVVDQIGIRTYMGAPLIDTTGTTLGTICVIGPEPRPLASGRAALTFIKERCDELMQLIYRRACS